MPENFLNKVNLIILVSAAFLVGSFLRLHMISDQVLNENEWYDCYIASVHGYRDILGFVGHVAYSIPLNIYKRLTMETIGWNDIVLRLPSIVAGIFSLLMFPLLLFLNKTLDKSTAAIFALFLSISPVLIHYSRNSEPYSIVMFLSFAAVVLLYHWLTSGKYRYLLMYIVAGVMSVYFHLYSAVAVLFPLCCTIILKLILRPSNSSKENVRIIPGLSIIALSGLSVLSLLCLLFLPVIMTGTFNGYIRGFRSVEFDHGVVLQSLYTLAQLLSGSSHKIIMTFSLLLVITGQVFLIKERKLLAFIFGSILLVSFLTVITDNTAGLNSPDVITLILPIVLLSEAAGFNKLLGLCYKVSIAKKYFKAELLVNVLILSFMVLLFYTGNLSSEYRLPENYDAPANYRLTPVSADKGPYYMRESDVPEFYKKLTKEKGDFSIIEYPLIVPDNSNIYANYQSFHKKRVLNGFFISHALRKQWHVKNTPDSRIWPLEIMLGDLGNMKINITDKRIIDLYDINTLKKSDVKYIILHKRIIEEMKGVQRYRRNYNDSIRESNRKVARHVYNYSHHFKGYYQRYIGKPVFEDKWLIVFQI